MTNTNTPRINFKKKSIVRLSSDEMKLIAGGTPQRNHYNVTTILTTGINIQSDNIKF